MPGAKQVFKVGARDSLIATFEESLQLASMADEISTAIAEARARRGMTASEVARAMNTSPQAVYNWEKGKNRPASKNLLALAQVLRVDGARFLEGEVVLIEGLDPPVPSLPSAKAQPPREVELAPDAPDFGSIGGSRDVPEYGIAVGGEQGDFTLNGEVVGYVTRPLSLKGRSVFAVRVKGSSMYPRFDEGDVLYVERHREPAIGDDGIFEMKPNDEWEAGRAFVKQLVAKGMGIIKVRQFNPDGEIDYKRDQIARMFRVVPRNELMSV